jgi:hypothetical protein
VTPTPTRKVTPTPTSKVTPRTAGTTPSRSIVGGTIKLPPGASEESRQAAYFAAQQLSIKPEFAGKVTLEAILSVRTQVVAGLKYYIAMTITTPKGRQNVDVVVWRKVGNTAKGPNFELMSWSRK